MEGVREYPCHRTHPPVPFGSPSPTWPAARRCLSPPQESPVMALHFRPDLLQVEVKDDVTVVKLTTPRFDDSNAVPIGQQLADLVDRLGRHKLHLDLGEVEFLSSVGLSKLLTLNKKVQAAGGELRLHNVGPVVYEVFEVTQLTRLLDIRPKGAGPGTPLVSS